MYRPGLINWQQKIIAENSKRIDDLIEKGKRDGTMDSHTYNRLQEEKLLGGMFSPETFNYGKYKSPW